MRYPASEKLEIIRLVEGSHLPAKVVLDKLGISRPTFYRWYDLYQQFGKTGLEDKRSGCPFHLFYPRTFFIPINLMANIISRMRLVA